jgi:hypothetical protein
MLKPPSVTRAESGVWSASRFSRMYCTTCRSEELHHSCVCVQCKRGSIQMKPDPVRPLSAMTVRKRFNP